MRVFCFAFYPHVRDIQSLADVSITQGHAIPYATQVAKYGGIHLDDYLEKFLMERGFAFRTSWDKEIVTDMKVEKCSAL